MTTRSTVIATFDGYVVRIPKATVFETSIISRSADPERRFTFAVGLGYNVELAEAIRLSVQIVAETLRVMDRPRDETAGQLAESHGMDDEGADLLTETAITTTTSSSISGLGQAISHPARSRSAA